MLVTQVHAPRAKACIFSNSGFLVVGNLKALDATYVQLFSMGYDSFAPELGRSCCPDARSRIVLIGRMRLNH
jgi:hypothetical protein